MPVKPIDPRELRIGDLITFRAAIVYSRYVDVSESRNTDKALTSAGPKLGIFLGFTRVSWQSWDSAISPIMNDYILVFSGQFLWVKEERFGSGRGVFELVERASTVQRGVMWKDVRGLT